MVSFGREEKTAKKSKKRMERHKKEEDEEPVLESPADCRTSQSESERRDV